jgi:hypothetical protein
MSSFMRESRSAAAQALLDEPMGIGMNFLAGFVSEAMAVRDSLRDLLFVQRVASNAGVPPLLRNYV